MNQAPLIADFTLSGPIVGFHRRGFDSSGQAQEEGVDKKVSEALAVRKHVNRIKILTNDRKDRKSHPRLQAKHRVSPQCLAGGDCTSVGLRFIFTMPPCSRNKLTLRYTEN